MTAHRALEITVLRDNTASRPDVSAGHGLALLVRLPRGTFLLDTGDSDKTWTNADALGVDLTEVDAVVLSHGHYDHTDGLPALIDRIGALHIIAHPAVFEPRWSTRGGEHYIGPPLSAADLEELGCWVELSAAPVPVALGARTTGKVPRGAAPTQGEPHLMVERNGRRIEDDFADDISVIVDAGEVPIVLTGCAHAGLINIVEHVTTIEGRCPTTIIGGTHLAAAPEDAIAEIAADLYSRGVRTMVPMHCTGERGAKFLKQYFAGEVVTAGTGSVITVAADGSVTVGTT